MFYYYLIQRIQPPNSPWKNITKQTRKHAILFRNNGINCKLLTKMDLYTKYQVPPSFYCLQHFQTITMWWPRMTFDLHKKLFLYSLRWKYILNMKFIQALLRVLPNFTRSHMFCDSKSTSCLEKETINLVSYYLEEFQVLSSKQSRSLQ